MVDPKDLVLVEHLVDDRVEIAETLGGRAERLLVDHPGALGQPVFAQALGDRAEADRRHREVVDELRVAAHVLAGLGEHVEQAARVGPLEAATGEAQPVAELLPRPVGRPRPELGQHVVHVRAEVEVRDVAAAVADQQPVDGQESVDRQAVERR